MTAERLLQAVKTKLNDGSFENEFAVSVLEVILLECNS